MYIHWYIVSFRILLGRNYSGWRPSDSIPRIHMISVAISCLQRLRALIPIPAKTSDLCRRSDREIKC